MVILYEFFENLRNYNEKMQNVVLLFDAREHFQHATYTELISIIIKTQSVVRQMVHEQEHDVGLIYVGTPPIQKVSIIFVCLPFYMFYHLFIRTGIHTE